MYRKYYLVEVIILILLSHGGWNGPSVTLLSCTSESSKLVRDVVQKRFLPLVERYRVSLPLECPLHPRRDMFWWLQTELEATRNAGEETWHCPVCGQKFRCENTFVTHWDASHARTVGITEETVCLDDFCDVFRCDMLRKKMLLQRRIEEEELKMAKTDNPAQVTSLSIKLQNKQFDEDEEEIRRNKLQCDPKVMSRLHNKCRSLIRQCTIGMLANLSSKDFQDIEDDLDEAICSFLTCDRYWDDFDSHIHHVPVLVLAVFGLLATSFFCFCYYGTWVLLEKNPMNSNQLCCNCQKSKTMEPRHRQKAHHYRYRQKSPEFISRQTSPELISRKTSPELMSRKTSPDLICGDVSPEYMFRQTSPRYRQTSPDFIYRQESPEYLIPHTSSEYQTPQTSLEYSNTQTSTDFMNREKSPELRSRQTSPDYVNRHTSSKVRTQQMCPECSDRKTSPEYMNRQSSPEYSNRQTSPEYLIRETSPEYSNRQKSPEYLNRERSPEYLNRERSPEYSNRQKSPEYPNRERSPEYPNRERSPEYMNQQTHPEIGIRQKSPGIRILQTSPEATNRQTSQGIMDEPKSSDFLSVNNRRAPSRCGR